MNYFINKIESLPDDIQKGIASIVAIPLLIFFVWLFTQYAVPQGLLSTSQSTSILTLTALASVGWCVLIAHSISASVIALSYAGLINLFF